MQLGFWILMGGPRAHTPATAMKRPQGECVSFRKTNPQSLWAGGAGKEQQLASGLPQESMRLRSLSQISSHSAAVYSGLPGDRGRGGAEERLDLVFCKHQSCSRAMGSSRPFANIQGLCPPTPPVPTIPPPQGAGALAARAEPGTLEDMGTGSDGRSQHNHKSRGLQASTL